jgi:hypothetical protein
MRRRLATTAVALTAATVLIAAATAATIAAAAPAAHAAAPTRAQIRAAVRKAEGSRLLWATINICNTARHPRQVGVRAQMPALGFPAALSMRIQVKYFTGKLFKPDPGVHQNLRLGTFTRQVHQGGRTFQFGAHAGLLTGAVTFQWRRFGRLLGQATRPTTPGHHDADFGDPRGHSAAACRIR